MDDPWQFLILDRNTATERDVKAAYARLLKQHRPDQDPEGFQKLRAAYEAALAAVERRDSGSEPPPAYAADNHDSAKEQPIVPPRPQPPSVVCDEAQAERVREAFANLEHAAASRNTAQMQAAVTHFLAAFRRAQLPASNLIDVLRQAFDADAKTMARGVTEEALVYLAEHGQTDFCHTMISIWQETEDRNRFWTFGDALLQRRMQLATPEGAALMARVGLLGALQFPDLANSLANASFPYLSVEGRQELVSQIENGVALGKLFAHVPRDVQPFWFRLLRDKNSPVNWSAPEAQRAVDMLVERCRFPWGGWGVVKQLMPAELWAAVEQRLQKQAKQAQGGGALHIRKRFWVTGVCLVVALLGFVSFLINVLSHEGDGAPQIPVLSKDELKESEGRKRQPSLSQDTKNTMPAAPSGESKEFREAMQRLDEKRRKAAAEQQSRAPTKVTPVGQNPRGGQPFLPPVLSGSPNPGMTPLGQPGLVPSNSPSGPQRSPSAQDILGGGSQSTNPSRITITLPNGLKVEVANPPPPSR